MTLPRFTTIAPSAVGGQLTIALAGKLTGNAVVEVSPEDSNTTIARQISDVVDELTQRERQLAAHRERIVQAALVWYDSTNEAELAAAVMDYRAALRDGRSIEVRCHSCRCVLHVPIASDRERVDCRHCAARFVTRRDLDGEVSLLPIVGRDGEF